MRSLLLLAFAAMLAACVPAVQSAVFMPADPQPPDHEIRLYSTKLPDCPYDELGLVGAFPTPRDSLGLVLDSLKSRARTMGGDAIVGVGQQVTATGGHEVRNRIGGTVIRFTKADCRK